jgi:thymidylate synthase (FAD)
MTTQTRNPRNLKKVIDDISFVELVDTFGDELTIVNAARVSFGRTKKVFDKSDERLVKYLITHKHYSPFRQVMLRFRIKAPEFVMRQLFKHCVGTETTSTYPTQLHSWNEISGRYKLVREYHTPSVWRAQSKDNKQASEGVIEKQEEASELFNKAMETVEDCYKKLVELGVAKEQARMITPLNQYTEIMWTVSLQALFNFIELRYEKTAQGEIQEYARVMLDMMREKFPMITDLWTNSQ